jgi:hypothetical protein
MRIAPVILLGCFWLVIAADGRSAGLQTKTEKAEKKQSAKKEKAEPVPGYKHHKIEGFNFLIAEEVFKQDFSAYERKPLEALELECKTLAKILTPGALEAIRGLVIWVEWDEKVPLSNGRPGNSLAVYSGASQAQVVKDGKHPLRARTVTIHSLKMLTDGRQPKRDRGDCVLLHEIAHAVHHQVFGFNHAGIKAAYQQAMERKLYDKNLYAATNEREFFAELTCAYLDRLRYYPHNRADLQKHDPNSFKLMESLWASAAKKADAGKKPTGPADGSDQFDLTVTLPADVKFGASVLGPEPTAESVAGKVVVVAYWSGNSANLLNRLDRLHEELSAYGLVAIAPNATVKTPEEIKADAEKRCDGVSVLDKMFVKDRQASPVVLKTQPAGHALVFDHTGKCVYRGSGYDADRWARVAVGRKLLAHAAGAEPPTAFKSVAEAVENGTDPVALLPKVRPLTNSQDEAVKLAANKLSEAILAPGQKALDDAKAAAKTDPVAAFVGVEYVLARFKNTPLATKAQPLAVNLRQDRAVASELKARAVLSQVQKAETYLRGQPGSFDPTSTQFQNKHRQPIAQMQAAVEQLRKQYPNARATAEAVKIAREFGID